MPAAVVGAWRATGGSFAVVVTANSVTETRTITVTTGREYWLTGDGRVDSADGDGDLLSIIASAIAGHSELATCSVRIVSGRVQVTTDVPHRLDWADASTTFDPAVLGFAAANTLSSTSNTGSSTCPYVWLPGADISQDTRDRQDLKTGRRESLSGLVYAASFGSATKTREVTFELLGQDRILEEYAGTGATAWETFDRLVVSLGRRVRLYEDVTSLGSVSGFATYVARQGPQARRNRRYTYRWNVELDLRASGLDTRGVASGSGFTDPAGLSWVHAWDFSDIAAPASALDVPALVGSVDLSYTVGALRAARGTAPSYVVPSALNLDEGGVGPLDCDLGGGFTNAWTATLTGLATSNAVHMRAIVELGASNSGEIELGTTDTDSFKIQFANNGSLSRILGRTYVGTTLIHQRIYDVPHGHYLIDMAVWQDGSAYRLDMYVNGDYQTSSTVSSYPSLGSLLLSAHNVRIPGLQFIGIASRPNTSAPISQTVHDASINRYFSAALLSGNARTFDYQWLADGATSGLPWVDTVAAYSVPWTGAAGYTVSPQAVSGLSDAALGSARSGSALRVDSGNATIAGYVWQNSTSGDATLAISAGESMWIRAIVRHIDPATNDGDHATLFEVRDASPTAGSKLARLVQYDTAAGNGGGLGSVFDNAASPLNAIIAGTPDTRSEWNIFDVYVDGTSGDVSLYVNGKTATGSGSASIDAFVDPYFGLLRQVDCDVAMIAMATGANADEFSEELHNHDVALLGVSS